MSREAFEFGQGNNFNEGVQAVDFADTVPPHLEEALHRGLSLEEIAAMEKELEQLDITITLIESSFGPEVAKKFMSKYH